VGVIREAARHDLDAVATLVARRHARVLGASREMSPAFTDPAVVRGALPDEPHGWVDDREGVVSAALLWEPSEGRAIAGVTGAVGSPEAMAALYTVAGEHWLGQGLATHEIVVPTVDRALADRLVDLSFGREEAYAIRPLGDRGGPRVAGDVEVERVGLEHLDEVIRLGDLVARHHEGSPVFDRHSNEFYSGLPESYRRSVTEQDARVLLASSGGTFVGLLLWRPGAPFPVYHERSAEMILLAVHPESRGRQVGRALVSTAMRDMASFGHNAVIADWRTTNLEASRFWPAQGFLTVAQRYVRTIPDRPSRG
jgi:ribosomal protein S18 acetylase RimI-like enzyme